MKVVGVDFHNLSTEFHDRVFELSQALGGDEHLDDCPIAHGASAECTWPISVCLPADTEAAVWTTIDPRHVDSAKDIVVTDGHWTTFGYVERKHGWAVFLTETVNGRRVIGENDEWPEFWSWTRLPKLKRP